MKYTVIFSLVTLVFLSCKKEDPEPPAESTPTEEENNNAGNKTYSATIHLTVLDSLSNPLDSVACLIPFHSAESAQYFYYTDSNGSLIHNVYYLEQYGGMPESQYIELNKGTLADTIYVPLAGENSQNYFTFTLE